MYEYDYRQNGGFISTTPTYDVKRVIKSVTVTETFDENGKLISRETVTEYENASVPSYPVTINTNGISATEVENTLQKIMRQ